MTSGCHVTTSCVCIRHARVSHAGRALLNQRSARVWVRVCGSVVGPHVKMCKRVAHCVVDSLLLHGRVRCPYAAYTQLSHPDAAREPLPCKQTSASILQCTAQGAPLNQRSGAPVIPHARAGAVSMNSDVTPVMGSWTASCNSMRRGAACVSLHVLVWVGRCRRSCTLSDRRFLLSCNSAGGAPSATLNLKPVGEALNSVSHRRVCACVGRPRQSS